MLASEQPDASRFPSCIRRSTIHANVVYRRCEGWFGSLGTTAARGVPTIHGTVGDDPELGRIAIHHGAPDPATLGSGVRLVAVYESPESHTLNVPTGRIFVRFGDAIRAEDRRPILEALGFRIVDIPRYAPQAAWIEDVQGRIARALGRIRDLEALEDVENVEPQLLAPASKRADATPADGT